MDQDALNQEMLDLGVARYRKTATTSKGSLTNAGRRIMRDGVEPVVVGISELLPRIVGIKNKSRWQRAFAALSEAELRPIGLIAVKSTLDVLDDSRSYASTCFRLGRAVEDQLLSSMLIKQHDFGSRLVKRMQDLESRGPSTQSAYLHKTARNESMGWDDWTRRDRLICGSMLLEIVHDRTGLIKFSNKEHRARKHYKPMRMVEISDVTREWINDYNTHREMLLPFWLPMVESPVPWNRVFGGGYGLSEALPVMPFIRCSDREVLRKAPEMPEVYNAVNLIQETPYAINHRVLEMLEWAWDKDLQIGLPPRDDLKLPEWPEEEMTVEESRNWRDDKREKAAYNKSLASQRILISKILMLAGKFKEDRIFMPSSCDFRGRVYQIPSYLNYQGPDHCRGLLQFHRGMPIKSDDDLKWLGIHGANCFGNDKTDFDTRLGWADGFTRDAIRIAKDPKSNREWTKAPDPWQALAWCYEWAEFHTKSSKNFKTHLPCAMDATNSGLQLLSLLSRDEEGCFATNVAPTDTPQDIYRLVSEYSLGILKQHAKDGRDYARLWIDFGIDRKMSKRPVMCYSYGLTPYSNRDYVSEWYDTTRRERGMDCVFGRAHMYPAIKYLADILWHSIESLLTKPKLVMDWLQDTSRVMTAQDLALDWTTPSGFKVSQDYRKQVNQKVSTWLNGSLSAVRFKDITDELDPRKQSNGIAPNVVHSLDAAGLVLTVNEAHRRGVYDFAMIHDSFATHSNNCETLASSLRDSFADMFSKDLLANLREEWQKMSDEPLPELPSYGSFDVNTLRSSKYFFS